jgi:hypothetical protein
MKTALERSLNSFEISSSCSLPLLSLSFSSIRGFGEVLTYGVFGS